MDASEQLRREIIVVINRYTKEADLTIAQVIGVLELVKLAEIENTFHPDEEDGPKIP